MTQAPHQKWKAAIDTYRKNCQKILLISKSIRYVGLINEYGRTMTGIIRQGTNPLLKSGQVRNEFFFMSTLLSMRKTNYSAIGNMDYAIFKHRKVTLILFQRKEGTYYISIDQRTTLDSLIKLITKIQEII